MGSSLLRSAPLAAIVLAGSLGLPAAAEDAALAVQRDNGIAYVSGGIGDVQQREIKALGGGFSLLMTFATSEGYYLGGGSVVIKDAQGATLLDVETQGPIFYADLEPGTYRVTAVPQTYDGPRAERAVEVIENKQATLHFAWDLPAGDGSDASR